jgi:ClpX C4-type zinc finger
MQQSPPPPVLHSARVLSYAFVDDVEYRKSGSLFVNGDLLEKVPRLTIRTNLGKDIGPMLFHCDEEWNPLGTSGAGAVDQVKADAERNYPGVSSRWVDLNTTVEDALRYYDAEMDGQKCSFCGKRAFEVEGWVEGKNAIICRSCIEMYHHEFKNPPPDGDA